VSFELAAAPAPSSGLASPSKTRRLSALPMPIPGAADGGAEVRSASPATEQAPPITIGLAWLTRLRWGAVLSQLAVLGIGTAMLGPPDDLVPILGLIAVTPATNAGLVFWQRRAPEGSLLLVSTVLVLDALVLTLLLHLSGGAANPFTVFYLVHVALSAVLLDARGVWLLAAVTSAGFASLYFFPLADGHHHHGMDHGGGSFSLHLQGMWLAYTLAAGFVGYFVSRTSQALRDRDARVLELTQVAARAEKLSSLTTFAAGAAHELGTPLATIAIVAKELERSAERGTIDRAGLLEDAGLLRQEIERCRAVLGRLSAGAGELSGEGMVSTTVAELFTALRDELGESSSSQLTFRTDDEALAVKAPRAALIQVLASLVRNGLEASSERREGRPNEAPEVTVAASRGDRAVSFAITDHGTGLDEATLARLGEPFFSTKPKGSGLGLGVFLACAFAEQVGGRLDVASSPGKGTVFSLRIPEDLR
jgi:two-component system, sensor histidine kinase RegB